jgi:hypothetical protein
MGRVPHSIRNISTVKDERRPASRQLGLRDRVRQNRLLLPSLGLLDGQRTQLDRVLPIMDDAIEIQDELRQQGFELTLKACERVLETMLTEGKEAAADQLRRAGVPVKTQEERWNAVRFTKWTVNGFTLFCG